MKYDCIIWDWNGTLLDDVSASLRAVNDMLERRSMEKINIERYRECIGIPIRCFYEAVFEMEKEDYPSLLAEYNELYCRYVDLDIDLADGAREILSLAKENGAKQVIVSSSEKNVLEKAVARYGIEGYFDAVLGSDDFLAGSKVERAVDYIKRAYPGQSPRIIAFGDLVHDSEVGRAVGARCVLVESGHESRKRLYESGEEIVPDVKSVKELLF